MNTYILLFALVLGFACSLTNSQGVNQSTDNTNTDTQQNPCPGYCSMKPDAATRGKTPFRRWYFDIESKECKKFSYGGRGGNRNRFLAKEDCEAKCGSCDFGTDNADTCSLPVDPGRCESGGIAPQLLWNYDPETHTCRYFAYSGCGGNENKFDTEEKCKEVCDE